MTESFQGAQGRSVAAAGTDDLKIPLPYTENKCHHLTSFVVYVEDGPYTGYGGTVNSTGPFIFNVEAWLLRGNNKLLLDKGWAVYDRKYNRSVVGFVGRIHYAKDDVIQVAIKNAGAITGLWSASGAYDMSDAPQNEMHRIDKLHDDVEFIYQGRRSNEQTGAGGGALTTRVSMNTGQAGRLIAAYCVGTASAGSTLAVSLADEDGAIAARIASVTAGASRDVSLPSIGAAATATLNTIDSLGLILAPGTILSTAGSAAVEHEVHVLYVCIALLNDPTLPTWDTTGSAGTPVLSASTISVANTLQPIVRPRMIG